MPKALTPGVNYRAAVALAIGLLAGLALAAGFAVWRFYQIEEREVLARAAANLGTIAEMKARGLAAQMRHQLDDAATISRNPLLTRSIARVLHSGETRGEVLEWLRTMRDSEGYAVVSLADSSGAIRISTSPGDSDASPYFRAALAEAKASDAAVWTAPHRNDPAAPVHQELIAPLRAPDGRRLGMLVLRRLTARDPEEWLHGAPTALPTADVALLWRDGSDIRYIAPRKATDRQETSDRSDTAESWAVRGGAGLIEKPDHSGIPVIAAAAPLAEPGLYIFARQARSAVLAELVERTRFTALVLSLSILAVALLVGVGWHKQRERYFHEQYKQELLRQELLADRERRFRTISESIPAGVWMCDAAGALTYVNPSLERITGMPLDDLAGDRWLEAVHPDDRQSVQTALSGALATRRPFETRFRARRPGGEEITMSSIASPHYGEDGAFEGFVGAARDITKGIAAERQIRQLSLAVEQSPSIVIITNSEGRIEYVNPRFTAVTGYTLADVVGQTPRFLKSGDEPPEFYRGLWERIRSGKEWRGEFRNRRRNGELYWAAASISPLKDASGVVTHFVAVQEDITEWKRAEEEMRISADRINRMIACNLIGSMVVDGDSIVDANDGLLRTLGYSRDDLEAGRMSWRALTPPEYVALTERAEAELRLGGVLQPFEKEYYRKDGSRVPVLITATLFDSTRVVCFVLDLSVTRRSELEIERMNVELRRLSAELLRSEDAERRRLARELHDGSAQLLTGIALNIGRLQNTASLTPGEHKLLSESLSLVKDCAGEIRALSYALHPPLLDELGLVAAIGNFVAGYRERTGILVETDLASCPTRLDDDVELALFRIVQEALTNVHRHSGSSWAAVRLRCSAEAILLEIEDRGRGVRDRVSHPGFVGVGLLGMRERAQHMGGTMDVVSGKLGTTIRVCLPARSRQPV